MRSRCLPCWRWYNSFCDQGSGRRNSDTIQARIFANSPTGQKDGGLTNDPRPQRKAGGCNWWETPVERAIAEAVAEEGADVVIWLRKWNDGGNEAKVASNSATGNPIAAAQRSFSSYVTMAPVNGDTQILLVTAVTRSRRLRVGYRLRFSE
jgi:hypothetical protein